MVGKKLGGHASGRHLRPDELIDLAESGRAESQPAHLQACDACRRELADLRAALGLAAHADVPEPSPLFWDHLSARVHDAVAAEAAPERASTWLGVPLPRALPIWSGALLAMILAVVVTMRVSRPADAPAPQLLRPAVAEATAPAPPGCCADVPALALVADLVRDMDYEDVSVLEVSTHPGYADEAVSGLSTAEREELQRLIAAEMTHSGG